MSQHLKIGILGPVSRAVVWEKYLRPHPSVAEVIIASDMPALTGVHACILLDESDTRMRTALDLVRSGFHLFVVGRLPMQPDEAEKVFYAAEESGISVQYSNWSVFSEGTRWLRKQLPKFELYQSVRELEGIPLESGMEPFLGYVLEDISLAQSWSGSNVNRLHTQLALTGTGEPQSVQCFLRFENSASASVFFTVNSRRNLHTRYATSREGNVFIDVHGKKAWFRSSVRDVAADTEFEFSEPEPASYAVTQFIKNIQLKRESDFSAFHAVQLARTIHKIRETLRR
jgi:hypothetical protein